MSFSISKTLAAEASISGNLNSPHRGQNLILEAMDYESRKPRIPIVGRLTATGSFSIRLNLAEPTIYNVSFDGNTLLYVVISPGDSIYLTINGENIDCFGSVETKYLIDYEIVRRQSFNRWLKPAYDSLNAAVASGNATKRRFWMEEQRKAAKNYRMELAAWVSQPFFSHSLAAIHHSIRWDPQLDEQFITVVTDNFRRKFPGYDLTRQLISKVSAMKRLAIGAEAPDFELQDHEGIELQLSDFRGQYVLLDFWASWCGPCRQENPLLVRLHEEYEVRGFTILSISIDTDPVKWKKAIVKDRLNWKNASDLNGYQSPVSILYNINSIPMNFLLDSNGKILRKNIHGDELVKALKGLLEN